VKEKKTVSWNVEEEAQEMRDPIQPFAGICLI